MGDDLEVAGSADCSVPDGPSGGAGQSEACGRHISKRMGQTHATVPPRSFLSREDTRGERPDKGTDA